MKHNIPLYNIAVVNMVRPKYLFLFKTKLLYGLVLKDYISEHCCRQNARSMFLL